MRTNRLRVTAAQNTTRSAEIQCAFEVGRRVDGSRETGAPKVRLPQLGPFEARAFEVRVDQISLDEVGVAQIRATQIRVHQIRRVHRRAAKAGTGKVDPRQNQSVQLRPIKHDRRIRIFLAPEVVEYSAARQTLQQLLAMHAYRSSAISESRLAPRSNRFRPGS